MVRSLTGPVRNCTMPRFTLTVSGELHDFIEEKAEDSDRFGSKAEVVRHYLERGREADDLERDLEHAEARVDDLRRQLVERADLEEEVTDLVAVVEEEQRAADAPFIVRWARWWRSRS